MKMELIWEIRNPTGATISFQPTKGAAYRECGRLFRDGIKAEVFPFRFEWSKRSVVQLLNDYAGGAE
jgi:hypothetical protein